MGRQTCKLFLFEAFSPLDHLSYLPGMLGMVFVYIKGYSIPYHYLLHSVQGMFNSIESPKCQKHCELFKYPTQLTIMLTDLLLSSTLYSFIFIVFCFCS